MHLYIDTLAYTNRLRELPPQMKLLLAIATLSIALISHPPVQLAIFLWMTIWSLNYARIPPGVYFNLIAGAGMFLLWSLPALIIHIISVEQLPLVEGDRCFGAIVDRWDFYVSCSGVAQAMAIFIRAIASVSCLFFLLLTVPFVEVLQILRRWGLPTILAEILLLMYRFIFVLLETATQLWIAQKARNGHRDWRITMRSLSSLIGQLFYNTLDRYRQLSLTLASRGFNGEFQVWHQRRSKSNLFRRYSLEAVFGCVGLLGLELLIAARHGF